MLLDHRPGEGSGQAINRGPIHHDPEYRDSHRVGFPGHWRIATDLKTCADDSRSARHSEARSRSGQMPTRA